MVVVMVVGRGGGWDRRADAAVGWRRARREGAPPVRKVVRRQVLLREPRQRDAVDAALRVPVRVLPACMHIQGVLSVLKANGICFAIWESKPKANERQTESKRKAKEAKVLWFFQFS